MKLSIAGVACLLAAWTGVYAAPHHGGPRAKADATLENAMTASVQDAIRLAVTKAHASYKAHHTAVLPPAVHAASEHHVLAQRGSLRGKAKVPNPYQPAKPLRIMDHDLTPVSPMNQLKPAIEAQSGGVLPPGYWPRVVYYSEDEDRPNPFPKTYNPPVPDPQENYLVCHTSPQAWVDKKGIGCDYYESALWCTQEGKPGLKWKKSWGDLTAFGVNDVGAAQACCQCGGGSRTSVIGQPGQTPLSERRLLAPADRSADPKARWFERNNGHFSVPSRPLRPIQAPEDYVPMPIRGVAPLDSVPMKYSRYFRELHKQNDKDTPRGFSVRYYNVPPRDCSKAKAMGSTLDHVLDYGDTEYEGASLLDINASTGYSPVGLSAKTLQWPGNKLPVGGVFWAKWSGTVDIMDAGKYSFNLDIGFNTNSWFKVDGVKMKTAGQCRSSADKKICAAKGCKWDKEEGTCDPEKLKDKKANVDSAASTCKRGTYRTSAVLFGCDAQNGELEVQVAPSGATTVLNVPKGVKNFQLSVESDIDLDLQMKDKATDDWIVKFDNGIVNNQQRSGTYHGMAVTFSGDGDSHEGAVLSGVTSSPVVVSLMSYSSRPAKVKLIWAHDGLSPCPGKGKLAGCDKFKMEDGQKKVIVWSSRMVTRYGQCSSAWKAVTNAYPGGQISWTQWESVWSLGWGKEDMAGNDWKIGFAMVDTSHDGYVQEAEFLNSCSLGVAMPSPAPAPEVLKSGDGGMKFANVDTCITVQIMDKGSWPKDAFKKTGYKDDPALEELINSKQPVQKATKKGVLVLAPDGKQKWFYPKGTYYCMEAMPGPLPPAAAPEPQVSTRGPAPSIINVEPIIIGGPPQGLLQEDEDDGIYLGAGGHCLEAMVMVTPSARNLKLLYSGPDTRQEEVVIPGQVMNCDPIIAACAEPLRETCLNYRPQCPATSAA